MAELPSILWDYQTMPRASIGESSFCLAYKTEAMLLTNLTLATTQTYHFVEEELEIRFRINLYLIDEVRA